MTRFRKRALTASAAAALSLALLGATQGTQTDPLVTKSYIDSVAVPKVLTEVDGKLTQREQALVDKLNAAITQYTKDMDAKLGTTSGGGAASSAYTVVTVEAGKQLLGNTGCEILLRSGTATAVAASAPGLVDVTSGGTLANGGALEPNHLYLATADGRGLKATAAVTVLVRGSYTLA